MDSRTPAERAYDAQCLSRIEYTQAPAAPVTVETWLGDEGRHYVDFLAGEGITKVLIGFYGPDKPGIELAIGEYCLNPLLTEVITLADVRTLRDNLSTLLADPRVIAGRAAYEA